MRYVNTLLMRLSKIISNLRLALGLELLIGLALACGSLFVFGWLAEEIGEGETELFDVAVREFIHSFAAPELTAAMRAMSFAGSPLFLFLLGIVVIFALYRYRHLRGAILFAITTVGAAILLSLLKYAFQRARPEPFFDIVLPSSYSFPSGHSLGSFCFYLALATILTNRTGKFRIKVAVWTSAVSLVILIGISRIYLGVHYPSDVLAGFAAGFIWIMTIATADQLIKLRKAKAARRDS